MSNKANSCSEMSSLGKSNTSVLYIVPVSIQIVSLLPVIYTPQNTIEQTKKKNNCDIENKIH